MRQSNELKLAVINGYVEEQVDRYEKALKDTMAELEQDFQNGKICSEREKDIVFRSMQIKINQSIENATNLYYVLFCNYSFPKNFNSNGLSGFRHPSAVGEITKPFKVMKSKITRARAAYTRKCTKLASA